MKILLIADSYPPEIRSGSHLIFELAEGLHQQGHQVTVATTWPKYNLDFLFQPHHYKEAMDEKGVQIFRFKILLGHHNVSYWIRGLSHLWMPFKFIYKLMRYRIKPDAVFIYSPPSSLGLVGAWFRYRFSSKFIFNVQDIFPQNAIDLGILKNKIAVKIFKALEGFIYNRADIIATHSKGNSSLLKENYPACCNKIKELHNWIDIGFFEPTPHFVDFRSLYGINKTACVFVFAGIIGPSQGLEFLIDVAKFFQNKTDILFLIIGDGRDRCSLEKQAKSQKLKNIMFKPFISKKDYPALLKACDVGLVSLSAKNKTPVVPSKLLGYMAASLPVMGVLNEESDGHEIINKSKCGYSSTPDKQRDIIDKFNKLYFMRHEKYMMGKAGYEYVRANFSKEVCLSSIINFLS